jgi:hypothetical protein
VTDSRACSTLGGTRSRSTALVMAIAMGALACACGGGSSASTGVLKGTATPCIGPAQQVGSHAWKIQVVLRRGSTVIAKQTVFDSKAEGAHVVGQVFSFTEPAGSYSISGPNPEGQTVHIQAGTTSAVELTGSCRP